MRWSRWSESIKIKDVSPRVFKMIGGRIKEAKIRMYLSLEESARPAVEGQITRRAILEVLR